MWPMLYAVIFTFIDMSNLLTIHTPHPDNKMVYRDICSGKYRDTQFWIRPSTVFVRLDLYFGPVARQPVKTLSYGSTKV